MHECAVFTLCITNVDETTIDETEDLDIVMPIYNLIQYSSNYSETSGQLWFYSKDKATNFDADIGNTGYFKSFKYKAKLLRNTDAQAAPNAANEILKNGTIAEPLKYLRILKIFKNFWRLLEMLLIDCKSRIKT